MENMVVKNTFYDGPSSLGAISPLARAATDPRGAKSSVAFEDDEDDDGGDIGDIRGAPLALKSDYEGVTEPAVVPVLPGVEGAFDPAVTRPAPGLPETPVTKLCVQNTFLVTEEEDDEGDVLYRSQTDPTGGANRRYSRQMPMRVPIDPIVEPPDVEKEGPNRTTVDDDDSPLARTVSVVEKKQPRTSLEDLIDQDDELKRLLTGGVDNHDEVRMPPMPMHPVFPYGYPPMPMAPPMFHPGMYMPHMMQPPPMTPGGAPWLPELPEPGTAPPVGFRHTFHRETCNTGAVSADMRGFTKVNYEGLLSTITEAEVHDSGVHRYLVQFSAGVLSPADGVGFVFNPRLPCPKNIQKIVAIFANAHGRINIRVYDQIVKCQASIKPLELGEWIELLVDLDNKTATFYIWPAYHSGYPSGEPLSKAEVPYGQKLSRRKKDDGKSVDLRCGHFACVVKNTNVTVALGS